MAGGTSEPTKILRATTGGFQLKATMSALETIKKNGWHTDRPSSQVVTASGGWAPTELALTACEDTTEVKFLNKKGSEVYQDRERRYVHALVATKADGVWKITDGESRPVKDSSDESQCAK